MKKQTFDSEKKSDAFLRWYEESQIKTKDIDNKLKLLLNNLYIKNANKNKFIMTFKRFINEGSFEYCMI